MHAVYVLASVAMLTIIALHFVLVIVPTSRDVERVKRENKRLRGMIDDTTRLL